ncbi:MAG: NUDIX domain-containing protein [Eubacteriales bacterium]
MWQFYNTERKMTAAEAAEFLKTLGIADAETGRAHFHKHIFTHIEWAMTAYVVRTATLLPELSYFPAEEIGEKIALPSAFRWCMDLLP